MIILLSLPIHIENKLARNPNQTEGLTAYHMGFHLVPSIGFLHHCHLNPVDFQQVAFRSFHADFHSYLHHLMVQLLQMNGYLVRTLFKLHSIQTATKFNYVYQLIYTFLNTSYWSDIFIFRFI